MAVLYVGEFKSVGGTSNFNVAGALIPPIAEQTVAIGAGSVQCTNAFNDNTMFVRISTDAICSIAFGANPTATTGNIRLAANQIEYYAVPPGQKYKVAVITNT